MAQHTKASLSDVSRFQENSIYDRVLAQLYPAMVAMNKRFAIRCVKNHLEVIQHSVFT
jgi:hypothetical protein